MMHSAGRALLDHGAEGAEETRARRFAELQRRSEEVIGVKEMALTRNARKEDAASRAARFLDIDRRNA